MGQMTVASIEGQTDTVQVGHKGHSAIPWWLLSALLTMFVALVWVYDGANNFPAMWHPDEPSKVHQIITNDHNYYHPLLLLRTTQLILALTATRPPAEQVALTGRRVSAVSAGLAVLTLAVAAARLNGPLASLLVAAIVGTCPLLFALAHYMKEDVVFVLALSVWFLSMIIVDSNNRSISIGVTGLATGLVVSAKYIGIIVLPIAVLISTWRLPLRKKAVGVLILTSCALTVFISIGTDPLDVRKVITGVRAEVIHVASTKSHHGGFTWPVTSTFYIDSIINTTSSVSIICYIAWIYFTFVKRGPASQISVVLFPLLFLAVLQLSPVKIARYQLPVVVFCGFSAACALANLASAGRSWAKIFATVAFIAILQFNLTNMYRTWNAISLDTRREMAAWIGMHLSPAAVLAQEGWPAVLHGVSPNPEAGTVPVHVITVPRLVSFGSLDGARRAGVTHILLQQGIYGCHLD